MWNRQPVNSSVERELPGHSELWPAQQLVPLQAQPSGGGLTGLTWGPAASQQHEQQMHRPTIAAGTPIARRALGEALENEAAAASRAQGQLSVQGQMPVQGQQGPPHTMQPNPWGPNYRPPSNPQPADILHWQPQQDQGEHGGDLLSDLQRGNDVSRRVRPRNPEGVNMNAGGQLPSQLGGAVARPRKRLAANPGTGQTQNPAPGVPSLPQDPIRAADHAGHVDPYVAPAGLRFPTTPYIQPPPPPKPFEQDEGRLPIKVAHGGVLPPLDRVSNDARQYGVAHELGVDPATARMQEDMAANAVRQLEMAGHPGPLLGYDTQGQPMHTEPAPPPAFYSPQAPNQIKYDENAGVLRAPDIPQLERGPKRHKYIQDTATGRFYRMGKHGLLGGLAKRLKSNRRDGDNGDVDEELEDDFDYSDLQRGTLGWDVRSALFVVSALFSVFGLFVQGLLGGFALLNIFMTYMLYSYDGLRLWLRYYGPIGLACSRIYYSLISMSLVASAARLSRDQLRRYAPAHTHLKIVDWLQICLYTAAYITSTLATPLDDQLYYESQRNSRFHTLSFTSDFHSRLASYHALNLIRIVTSGIAFLLACYRCSPFVSEGVVQYEALQRALFIQSFRPGPPASYPRHTHNVPTASIPPPQQQQQQQHQPGGGAAMFRPAGAPPVVGLYKRDTLGVPGANDVIKANVDKGVLS